MKLSKTSLTLWLKRTCYLSSILTLISSLLGFIDSNLMLMSLLSHFRLQYCVAFIGLSLCFLYWRQWYWLSLNIVALAINLALIIPIYLPANIYQLKPLPIRHLF